MQNGNRPISAVLNDIVGNIQDIVRSELRLARTEVREELRKSRDAATMLGAGILLVNFALLFALLAGVYALSLLVPPWAAALIVAGGLALIAVLCVSAGISRIRKVRAVPRTTASVQENVEWAKQLTR
jgi:uncharacterized membrane protein YqjE